jgi:hypothetical protein
MPKPGFYNDNEYRAYPFVYRVIDSDNLLPNSAIVDAGIVLGLDAFDSDVRDYIIWLTRIERTATGFNFVLAYAEKNVEAATTELVFSRPDTDDQWVTVFSETAHTADSADPIWEGFLVIGPLADLRKTIAVNQTLQFARADYQIEPGLVQNLHNAFLRSITVANYDRPRIPACNSTASASNVRAVIVNKHKLAGDVRLKEGYNCQITQTDRANELSITAIKNAGMPVDAELCAHGSELQLYEDEPFGVDGTEIVTINNVLTERQKQSKFYSGGPACSDVISSINGLSDSNINIIGGAGVTVSTDGVTIQITRRNTSQTNCTAAQEQ